MGQLYYMFKCEKCGENVIGFTIAIQLYIVMVCCDCNKKITYYGMVGASASGSCRAELHMFES